MSAVLLPSTEHRREKFIGGSDIAAILDLSPWRDAVEVWADKIQPRADEDGRNAKAKSRGTRLEPYIRDMIVEEHGLEITAWNNRYVDADVPYFAAEIDFETPDGNGEIKTVHPFSAREWGEESSDELPLHYVAQVQWGMGIREAPHCDVFALIGDDLRHYRVHADSELIQTMRERARHFWETYVLRKIQPPINYNNPKRAVRILQRLYPGTNGVKLPANETQQRWKTVIQEAQEMVKHYEAVIDGGKAHLLSEMGSAALLAFPDGTALERKQVVRKAYTVESASYMQAKFIKLKEST